MLQVDERLAGQTGFDPADPRDAALTLGALLHDHRALDAVVLDLRGSNSWTDFFVIATATSISHLEGLERHIKDFCREQGLEILRHSPRPSLAVEDDWRLTDLGNVVVHLMSERARNFYELERLWSAAPRIFP
ncbi:MAG: ribosome silencing factor [Treponema sp.]|jgi:ribosome-associated protein|nr:ribosome silencing factor [Treponema sp.]